jgi:hypothetical protein
MPIKRYDCITDMEPGGGLVGRMEESPDGDWVRYEDVVPAQTKCRGCGREFAAATDECFDCWRRKGR